MKQKHSYIQFFAMSGILLLSVRSLGQKYRIHDLQEDTAALRDEQLSLSDRINNIKSSLRREAALDSSGLFAARLRLLFGNDEWLRFLSATNSLFFVLGFLGFICFLLF